MQSVTQAYKTSIKQPLRNRGYVRVYIGVVSVDAQKKADVASTVANFSNVEHMIDGVERKEYAYLYKNFMRLDNAQNFLPRYQYMAYQDMAGIIGFANKSFGTQRREYVTINTNSVAQDIYGLEIDFGDNYPSEFYINTNTGQEIHVTGNTKSKCVITDTLTDVTSFDISAIENWFKCGQPSSMHIKSLLFGRGFVYGNENITSVSVEESCSKISEELPQTDATISIINKDNVFDFDNENSPINFFETGQKVSISYGYDVGNGVVEYVDPFELLVTDWNCDKNTLTLRACDVLRTKNDIFVQRQVYHNSLFWYMQNIADIYDISFLPDRRLFDMTTNNPLPKLPAKELMQILANAGMCALINDRDGGLVAINTKKITYATAFDNADYPVNGNIFNDNEKDEYISLGTDYGNVTGEMLFPPRQHVNASGITGFISKMSNASSLFVPNFGIGFTPERVTTINGLIIDFGSIHPQRVEVKARDQYADAYIFNQQYQVAGSRLIVDEVFENCGKIELSFTGTEKPYQPVVINNISIGAKGTFEIKYDDMNDMPRITKSENIKNVIVPYYKYTLNNTPEVVVSDSLVIPVGTNYYSYSFDKPYEEFEIDIANTTANVEISYTTKYSVRVKSLSSSTGHEASLTIKAKGYTITEKEVSVNVSEKGNDVRWENPLIDDEEHATQVANWLAEYYSNNYEYEYSHRGFPELDCGDVIIQDNKFIKDMNVFIERSKIDFNQAFSGSCTTRKDF